MKQFYCFSIKRHFRPLIIVIALLLGRLAVNAQCYTYSLNAYQVSPSYIITSPTWVTLRAEMYNEFAGQDNMSWGRIYWYYQETGGEPFSMTEIGTNQWSYGSTVEFNATWNTTVWYCYYDYWTDCETVRIPYEFPYLTSTPPTPPVYVNWEYGYVCGNVARFKVNSNATPVLYKQSALGGNNYDEITSSSTGYFEIPDYNPNTQYYVGASNGITSAFYGVSFDYFSNQPLPVTGTKTILTGNTTTLSENSGNNFSNIRWFDAGGNLVYDGVPFTTPVLTANTTYSVRGYNWTPDGGTCVTDPSYVTIQVNQPPPPVTCDRSINIYQTSPTYALCYPQTVTLTADMNNETVGHDGMAWGAMNFYYQETGGTAFSSQEVATNWYTYSRSVDVYANTGVTVWVSYKDYWTGCESPRIPYEFYISPTPYLYIDYAYACGNVAKVKVNSNAGVNLYKLNGSGGYEYVQSVGSTFEITGYDAGTNYYLMASSSCSSGMYPLSFDAFPTTPPAITGNTTLPAGGSTTLTADNGYYYDYKWYDGSGNLLHQGSQYTTPVLTENVYTYQVRSFTDGDICVSDPATVTVTVNLPGITYSSLYNSGSFNSRTIDLGKAVGKIPGEAGTNGSGGATYSIPLYTPPGTNKMAPSIAVSYSSQAGNGVAGLGWNISGLSVIGRTGKDIFHNGIASPVTLSDQDAFTLDGMRLNAITGANGANGTIYASENETWSQIISYGGSANNPNWFKVIGKEGSIMEYGNSTDSRILTDDGANVIMWRLNKIIDINGNYVELKYANGYRDSRIDEIKYTGNLNTGLAPYNSIKFGYKERTDAATIWSAGASFKMKHLLNNVTVSSEGNLVKTYQFNYGYDYLYSMLKEVVETAYDGSSLNSTIFLYGDQQTPSLEYMTSDALEGAYDFFSGDFNADGKTDLLAANAYYSGGVKLHSGYQLLTDLTQSSATVLYMKDLDAENASTSTSVAPVGSFSNFLTSDYNGDGRDDVMHVRTSKPGSAREFYTATIEYTGDHNYNTGWTDHTPVNYGVPSSAGITYKYIHSSGNFIFPGDFDGDGNKDYILFLGRNKTSGDPSVSGDYVYKAFLTNTVTGEINQEIINFGVPPNANNSVYGNSIANSGIVMPFDFDGDGKDELLVANNYGSYVVSISRISAASGYSFSASSIAYSSNMYGGYTLFPGDFNGDGKTDFLARATQGSWWLEYSTGKGFVEIPFSFNPGVSWSGADNDHKIVVSDFNGDGKSDILHGYTSSSTGSTFNIYYSNGTISSASFQKEVFSYDHTLAYRNGAGFVSGDFNGDGKSDVLNRMSIHSAGDLVTFNANRKERLLSKVKDGYNGTYGFQYKLLTDKNDYPYFYNRTVSLDGPENAYPYNYIELPAYAVSGFTRPNGLAGVEDVTTYTYENGILNRQGRGFLGYKKVVAKDLTLGITSTTESQLNTDYALLYPVKQTSRLTSNNALLKENTSNVSFVSLSTGANDPKRFMQKIDKTLSVNYLTGAATETVNTYSSNYGNIELSVKKAGTPSGSTVNAVETVTTATTYIASGTPVPSLPEQVTVTRLRNGAGSQSDVTRFTYNNNGSVSTKTEFYGLPKAITTTLGYNGVGNITSSTVSAAGVTSRITNMTYDSKGRFAVSNVIAAGTQIAQTETRTYDGKWGKPLSSTASDCITTTYEYDVFGREKKATGPVFTVNYSLAWDVTGNNIYYGLTDYSGGKPDAKGWFDILGRETQKQMAGFNNQWLTNITTYDAKGNVSTTTNAYYSNETPIVTTKQYDIYNRLSQVSNSLNTSGYTYSQSGGNLQVTITDQSGHATSKTTDAAGRIIASSDKGGSLNFSYDSRGLQTETKHGSTVVITNTYDDYGRKTSLTDKNAGTITYDYDALGQLKTETDNSNHTYQMAYDDLGRTISRQGPEGTTTYEYYKDNTTGCSNNSLKKITGFNGVVKEFTYDNLMRPATEKITIDAVDYVTTTGYDAYSNVNKITYPSGVEVNRVFDISGNLMQVTGGDPGVQTTLFTASQKNGYGQYTAYTLGNNRTAQMTYENGFPKHFYTQNIQDLNFTWDYANRNLLSRQELIKGVTENFQYDALNRLTQYAVAGQAPNDITYDGSPTFSMGNIASKTDAGNYTYRTDKIHAVAYITNPTAISNSTVGQVITYTPFLKAETISENDYQLALTYGPDYQRVKSVLQYQTVVTETKIFAGEYEKFTDNTGTKELHYIQGGNGLCAIIVRSNGSNNFYVTYTDYLGSILTLTDLSGNIIAEQNFDPWGRKRNPQDWTYNNIPTVPTWLYRGFTGHEHLTQFALINMNGRLYDPIQGRMISPDVALGDVYNTQGYNRYSYANNNPLSYVDPDGNFILFAIGNVIAHAIRGDIHNVWDGFKYFGQGALAGIGSMVAGGLAQGVPVLGNLMAFANGIKAIATGVNVIMSLGRGIFTGDWTSLENANRLFWGQFYLDENKSFFGGVWEGISRNTFQFLQQAGGYATTSFTNAFGGGRWVSYYGGATALETFSEGWGGVTQGSFILGDRGLYADPGNPLFQHEYGHYVQSQSYGLLYYTKVGIPSLRSDPTRHDTHPAEQDANHRARAYFNHYVPGYGARTTNGWDYVENPILEGATGPERRIRWNWYDFFDITGLINANQLNSQND